MTTWTPPDTKSDGDLIDQTIWNNQIKNNLLHLLNAVEPLSLTNKSGSAVTEGMVVVNDSGNDSAFTTTTTAGATNVLGVVADPAGIANDAAGRVAGFGIKTVAVQGNVTRGNYLQTSTTAGRAEDAGSSRTIATFAVALTGYAGGGAGTVTAWVMVSTVTGGVPSNGVLYTTDASAPSGFSIYTAAQGRYIVGMPSGGTLAATVGTALSDQENRAVGQHTHTVNDAGHNHYTTFYGSGSGTNPALLNFNASSSNRNSSTETTGITLQNAGSVAGTNAPYIQLNPIKKD